MNKYISYTHLNMRQQITWISDGKLNVITETIVPIQNGQMNLHISIFYTGFSVSIIPLDISVNSSVVFEHYFL
jgi:hypothetical protein